MHYVFWLLDFTEGKTDGWKFNHVPSMPEERQWKSCTVPELHCSKKEIQILREVHYPLVCALLNTFVVLAACLFAVTYFLFFAVTILVPISAYILFLYVCY